MDGGPYRRALRLYALAADRWALIEAAYPSIDLIRETPTRFLSFVYGYFWERIAVDREKAEEFEMQLNAPLPWNAEPDAPPELWGDDEEAATWAALAGG